MEEQMLSKLYGYPALNVRKSVHKAYEDTHKLENPLHIVEPNALVGIEVEVENLKYHPGMPEFYWNITEDHSLRNSGYEFTSIPLRGYQIEPALRYLHQFITVGGNVPDYSPRTSIHVHLNVRDMTWDQVKTLVTLYSIFERHFFHIAGTKRESSIFCVPLYKCVQKHPISVLEGYVQSWSKYNALNLGTVIGTGDLPKYGTIEFRHLYGTDDKVTIIDWINNILKLRRAAATIPFKELLAKVRTMNTTSEYVQLYQEVFGEYADTRKMVKYDFEDCVTHTKLWEWGNEVNSKMSFLPKSRLYTTYQKDKVDGPELAAEPVINKYKIQTGKTVFAKLTAGDIVHTAALKAWGEINNTINNPQVIYNAVAPVPYHPDDEDDGPEQDHNEEMW